MQCKNAADRSASAVISTAGAMRAQDILDCANGESTSAPGKQDSRTLSGADFLSHFLFHVLPKRF